MFRFQGIRRRRRALPRRTRPAPIVQRRDGHRRGETHLLDFGHMKPAESAELGSVLHRLVPAVKAATGVQRVYYLGLMERAPHFHLWLVPKKDEGDRRGVEYMALST